MAFKTKFPPGIRGDSVDELRGSVTDLAKFIDDEFGFVASAITNPEPMKVYTSVPPKPRTGFLAYADGAHWNPGSGEGVYRYGSDNAWHFLG